MIENCSQEKGKYQGCVKYANLSFHDFDRSKPMSFYFKWVCLLRDLTEAIASDRAHVQLKKGKCLVVLSDASVYCWDLPNTFSKSWDALACTFWSWITSNCSFFHRLQVTSRVSLNHLKAPASDWSFIQACFFYLPHIQQHRFCQPSSKFCPWWVPLKIRDRQSLRKINSPSALMPFFNLFRECGAGAVLCNLETLQHSCGIMVSNQNAWMFFTHTVSAKGPSKRQFTLS